ncbi:hypothetical protein ISG33_00990 [Glaciecola sp. MH2013]|nr:hypothetical protein [Glaciecola sp. MH2013]
MILKEHIQHAELIDKALTLCETMLSHCEMLYPFAVLSVDDQVQCLFLDDSDTKNQHPNGASFGMIEKLERLININKIHAENAVGLLVYAATLRSEDNNETDGLMFSLCDSNGENTLSLYPYSYEGDSIALGKPYTCDFSD